MNRDTLKILLGVATIFFLVVAIVLFILGVALDLSLLPKVILIIVAILALALSGELGYFTFLLIDKNPNYFLYNSKAKRNISVQKLTFGIVNSRMNRYLSGYATSEGKIWNERVLDNPYLEMDEQFKPLVAYKLLFGLADRDSEMGWKCLENASEETILFICNGLEANGDKDFSAALSQRMRTKPVNLASARDLIVKNKRYLQSKMTKYVLENIDSFNKV